jgi:hypothetical protein
MKNFLFLVLLSVLLSLAPSFCAAADAVVRPRAISMLPGSTALYSRQALTVVFDRSVIALGQDTGPDAEFVGERVGSSWMADDPLCPLELVPALSVPVIGRWVTTSIYRVDLDGSVDAWPTDLQFTARIKQDLTSWDGAQVNLTGFKAPTYTTQALSMYAGGVTSATASALVDGVYDACLNAPGVQGHVCELAHDANVIVSFTGPVEFDAIRTGLVVSCPSRSSDIAVASLVACSGYLSATNCVNVTFAETLPVGEICALRLPEGTQYHPFSGPVTREPVVEVSGLFPFVFPYRSYGLQSLEANQFALLLRHGLQEETTAGGDPVAALQAALRIDPAPEGPVTLTRQSPSTLVLTGPWSAKESFSISFGPEADVVRSGFGEPFLGTEQEAERLATAAFPHLLYDFASSNQQSGVVSVGDSSYASDWTVIVRNDSTFESATIAGWTMDSVDDVLAALAVADKGVSSSSSSLGKPTVSPLVDPALVDTVQTLTMPTDTLFGTTGVFFRRLSSCRRTSTRTGSQCYNVGSHAFVVRTPWAIHVMGKTLFISDTETGQPVAGATVKLQWTRYGSTSVSGVTNADGIVTFDRISEPQYHRCDAVVSLGDQLFVARSLEVGESTETRAEPRMTVVVTTARRLHRAGEDVHFKGYLKEFDGVAETTFPETVQVRGTWRRSGTLAERSTVVVVPVDAERGSFDGVLPILENAEYGEATIVVEAVEEEAAGGEEDEEGLPRPAKRRRRVPGRPVRVRPRSIVAPDEEPYYYGGGGSYGYQANQVVGSTTVVVADPRIPTATLDVAVDELVYRSADGVTLVGTLATYIGTPIAGASVDVVWRLDGIPAPPPVPIYYGGQDYGYVSEGGSGEPSSDAEPLVGTFSVTSDATGALSHAFRLPTGVPVPPNARLTFEVSFVGPTRELITAEASVPVRESELEVTLSLPATTTVIPGQSFVATANVLDVTGSPVADVAVDLQLFRLAPHAHAFNLSLTPEAQDAVLVDSQSIVSSGDGAGVPTLFQLPTVGVHALVASAVDDAAYESVRTETIGRGADAWSRDPLTAWAGGSVTTDRSEYADGETVTVSVLPPFSPCTMFVRFGRNEATVQPCPVAHELTPLDVGSMDHEGCGEFCSVHITFIAPRGEKGLAADVPVRASFDPTEPAAIMRSVQLARVVPNTFAIDGELTVTPSVASANPGDEVFVTVEGAGASAEIHLFVVDEKILDLSPHPLLNVADAMHDSLSTFHLYVPTWVSEAASVSHRYLSALVESWDRRVRIFPWLNPSQYYSSTDPLDLTDEEFAANFYAKLTDFPWSWRFGAPAPPPSYGGDGGGDYEFADGGAEAPTMPMMMKMMDVAEDDAERESGGVTSGAGGEAGSGSTTGDNVRGEAVYVALSATAVADPSGLVRFRVVLPDNLSTFKLRALAVTADGSAYGSAEADLVSARFINLEPSLPRIARVGDVFVAGTTVTLSSMDQGERTVLVSLVPDCRNVQVLSPHDVKVTLTSTTPVRVEWALEATVVGTGNVRLVVEDGSLGVVDSIDATFDVQGWQEPVTVGTSFALRADAATEGVTIPDHVPGSGSMTIAAGVGRLPAAKAIAAKLQAVVSASRVGRDPSALDLVGATAPLACLASYASDAVQEHLEGARAAADAAADLLARYTNPSPWSTRHRVGLVMYPPVSTWWWSSQETPRPNLQLNAFALFAHRLLLSAGLPDGMNSLGTGGGSATIADEWRSAVNRAVGLAVQDAKEAGRRHVADLDGLTAAYLALGIRHTFGSDVAEEDRAFVSLDMLVERRDDLSFAGRAQLALALAYEDAYAEERDAIVATLTDALRIQGRTAYIARGVGAASSDLLASARLLAVQSILERVGSSTGLPWDKLANGVASLGESSGSDSTSGYYYPFTRSAIDNTFSLLSLVTYDAAVGSATPDATALVVLSASSQRYLVLEQHFSSPADESVSETISLAALAESERERVRVGGAVGEAASDELTSLEFGADGDAGEISFTLTLDYVPAALPTVPLYRGFTVTKIIRALDPLTGGPTGEPLTSALSGTQVIITIDVHSPDDVRDVALFDPLPGGLEAQSVDGGTGESGSEAEAEGRPWGWWWYRTWSHSEARADGVFAHAPTFTAGTHTFQYPAHVVTPGLFVLPPAKVSSLAHSELLGLSAGGSFRVSPREEQGRRLLDTEREREREAEGEGRCFEPTPGEGLSERYEEEEGDTFEGVGGGESERERGGEDEANAGGGGGLSPGIVALLVILALVAMATGSAVAYFAGRRRTRERVSGAGAFVEDPLGGRKSEGVKQQPPASSPSPSLSPSLSPSPSASLSPTPGRSTSRAARRSRGSSRSRSTGVASRHHRRPLIT